MPESWRVTATVGPAMLGAVLELLKFSIRCSVPRPSGLPPLVFNFSSFLPTYASSSRAAKYPGFGEAYTSWLTTLPRGDFQLTYQC